MAFLQFEAPVTQIIQRTKYAKSIRFARPERFNYLPGQWISLTLGRGDEQKMKQLSLSSSPTEGFLEVTKQLTGHEFSNALNELRVGDIAFIRGPRGNFTFHGEYDKICTVAGGIGITPQRSIIRYATDSDLKTSIILIYSNRYEDRVAFSEDLDEMQKRNQNLKIHISITRPSKNWRGQTGRISKSLIESMVPDYLERIFYMSGPPRMVEAVHNMLTELGLPETQIKQEDFLGYE
ncbi:MAG: ferredoxin--NADP reductase [Halobacteriota archaeon]